MAILNGVRITTRARRLWDRTSNPPLFAARSRVATSAHAAVIHAFTRREILKRRTGGDRIWLGFEWVVWYACVPARVLMNTYLHAAAIRKRTGKGFARQALEQLELAYRGSIPPKTYYRFQLYNSESRAQAGDYLHRFETKATLYPYLRSPGARRRTLDNKLTFARNCRRDAIPSVPVLMEFSAGEAIPIEADALPLQDLISKPRFGRGGRDVVRWCHLGDDRYESDAGVVLDRDALVLELCERSRQQPLIVQPRLFNHPDLDDLSRQVLMTVRMLTCTNEQGDAEVTNACFRIGGAHPVVDNMHRGGIAAVVELASGRLGPAIGAEVGGDWIFKHPDTDVPIAGRLLPHWPEALNLACRAHSAYLNHIIIGWDIALLKEGPCLVEGNAGPCVNLMQRPLGGPLGSGRFGELVAHRIKMIEQEEKTATMRSAQVLS